MKAPLSVPARCRSPSSGPARAIPEERALAQLAKALAHPARVRIVRFLAERRECFCGDIVDALPLAQSTVSQHLKILKKAGLVQGEIDGPRTCYCLNRSALDRLKLLVSRL
ncbi:MAG: metalloregulator ArsR/SmtB family transcription factor [Planctomycetota bacterium]|nr:metalloregulator ArsR/SmtB family transcription factor [Planctomycetota bacterium]MCX8039563.1 metalloregulator ArsR/SmtB family transcription factor [Planctomycetota bacterium]MDW8373827.1 metalloregulator ArsR/SmtB family transcription factor [Planctomycetota bacterium]